MGFPGNIFILVKIFVDTKAPLDVFKFTALDNYAGKYAPQTPTQRPLEFTGTCYSYVIEPLNYITDLLGESP